MLMHRDECFESLNEEVACFVGIERACFQFSLKINAFDEFEDDEGPFFVVLKVVSPHDVWVADFGDGSDFGEIVGLGWRAFHRGLIEALESDMTIESGIESAEDVCRSSGADLGERAISSGDLRNRGQDIVVPVFGSFRLEWAIAGGGKEVVRRELKRC